MEVGVFHQGDYFVSALLMNKKDRSKCEVIVVYGPTHHDKSEVFLEEVRSKCQKIVLPMVLGGNFNLIMGRLIKK
jgi:hypothetical protein